MGLVGEEWKRHRKIVSKAFPQTTIALVNSETKQQVIPMMAEWERGVVAGKVFLDEYSPES